MNTCKGCREQQTNETLCLVCIEDLNFFLREIPVLYAELGSVRLPGSVRQVGPWTSRLSSTGSPSPVRLEVVDLLDRGETLSRLLEWTDTGSDVQAICDGFRNHLLTTAAEPWAGKFFHAMRGLCRDLGRAVGQPEERPVGKCSRPVDGDELCRGQLMRSTAGLAYCRRCGDKPDVAAQPVWITAREAALIVGKPIETIRTWIKRGQAGYRSVLNRVTAAYDGPIGPAVPNKIWLPTALMLATVPQRDTVNHGSGAELSAANRGNVTTARQRVKGSGSDADVLGRVAPGNVTPPEVATSGTAVAPIPTNVPPDGTTPMGPDPAGRYTAGSDS